MYYPELSIARTAVIDYFESPQQRELKKIFTWDEKYETVPTENLIKYLRNISREIGLPNDKPHSQMFDGKQMVSHLMKNYPELRAYRDIGMYV